MQNLPKLKVLLSEPQRCVIITHFRPDADALGSSLGMASYLKKKGHEVSVITPSSYPYFLNWMPGNEKVVELGKGGDKTTLLAKKLIAEADIIFCLDFSNLDRIKELGNPIRDSSAQKVLIDHHLEPEHFAHFEYWDVSSASTAGLVFDFINKMGDKAAIDSDIASCLYAGLMTDTGAFKHPNTTQAEFLIASELVGAGADPSYVAKMIYDTNTLSRIRFTGFVLHKRLKIWPEYNTACIPLHFNDLIQFNVKIGDTEGLVNYGLSIDGIRLAVLMYDRKEEIKLSFRSLGNFSSNEIAKKYFNGGGHKNAAGGSSQKTLEKTQKDLLAVLEKYKNQLNG